MIRLAAFGTHCTGKTSLIEALSKVYPDVPVIPEMARAVAAEWGLTPATIPARRLAEFQNECLARHTTLQLAYTRLGRGFLSDRSSADYLAYLDYFHDREAVFSSVAYNQYSDRVRRGLHDCDIFIYVPKMFPLQADGARHEDEAMRATIDRKVVEIVQFLLGRDNLWPGKVRLYKVRSYELADRVAEVTAVINQEVARRGF